MKQRIIAYLMGSNAKEGKEPDAQRAAEFLAGAKSFKKYVRSFKGIGSRWTFKDYARGRIKQYPIHGVIKDAGRRGNARRNSMEAFFCRPQWDRPAEYYEQGLNQLHDRMNPNTGWR